MGNVVVVGSQWGDEGKGKIVDWLSYNADVVVRFQGGHNAGHTLVIDGKKYQLSLLPSGIVRNNKISVIGSGVVIDPKALQSEISTLRQEGINITPDNLLIAENAALILSVHQQMDQLVEKNRGNRKIGTTGRGIGPAYEDKVGRRAIRICDLADKAYLSERVSGLLAYHNALRKSLGEVEISHEQVMQELADITDDILPYARPVWRDLFKFHKEGKRILFEGAQGAMLDVDYGTYPFVTSSSTLASQAYGGSGFGNGKVDYVLGITKAYTTRVGSGPFPTAQENETGEYLGKVGHEFGTVTGRKRQCGWFDAVLVRQAAQISGITGIALTKLDVLDGMKEIKICTSYRYKGETLDYLPASISAQHEVEPVYETLPGWEGTTAGARKFSQLPKEAVDYIRRIEELIETPISVVSTSPEREDTILVEDPFLIKADAA